MEESSGSDFGLCISMALSMPTSGYSGYQAKVLKNFLRIKTGTLGDPISLCRPGQSRPYPSVGVKGVCYHTWLSLVFNFHYSFSMLYVNATTGSAVRIYIACGGSPLSPWSPQQSQTPSYHVCVTTGAA